jgi:hypothetical protein
MLCLLKNLFEDLIEIKNIEEEIKEIENDISAL